MLFCLNSMGKHLVLCCSNPFFSLTCLQDCLDAELSASTLVETFEKYNSESNVRPSASLSDVDIEKNLLKNFLESQAGQMGTTGD